MYAGSCRTTKTVNDEEVNVLSFEHVDGRFSLVGGLRGKKIRIPAEKDEVLAAVKLGFEWWKPTDRLFPVIEEQYRNDIAFLESVA